MKRLLILLALLLLGTFLYFNPTYKATDNEPATIDDVRMVKDVGEAAMDHFGLTDKDFRLIKQARNNVIEGNFDICAEKDDVQYFLDAAHKNGLQVILPAGAGEAEWGYACDKTSFPKDQKPVWNKKAVVKWVNLWKNHPALYAWDISNEAGSVFPNASWYNEKYSSVPNNLYLTAAQIKTAYKDVKSADPNHPIMIRMNGWFFYDYDDNFFRTGNPFTKDMSDIVMVNAYSNVSDYYSDFVATVMSRAEKSIKKVDPDIKFIVALGTWREEPLWKMPTVEHLKHDLETIKDYDLLGVAYFKYGAADSEWYLPDEKLGNPKLWKAISEFNKSQ